MKITVKRAFYGDEKGVKEGQVIDVSDARGKELISRNLAERYEDFDSLHSSASGLAMNHNSFAGDGLTGASVYDILSDGLDAAASGESVPTSGGSNARVDVTLSPPANQALPPVPTSEAAPSHAAAAPIEPGNSGLPLTNEAALSLPSAENDGSAHTNDAEAAKSDEGANLQAGADTNAHAPTSEVAAKVRQTPKNKQAQTADNKS